MPTEPLGIVRGLQEREAGVIAANPLLSNAVVRRIQGKPPRIIASKTHAITVDLKTGQRTVTTATTASPFVRRKPVVSPSPSRPPPFREVGLRQIFDAVARAFEVTLPDMLGRGRCRRWAYPRFAAYRLLKQTFGWSTPVIGRCFSKRDHTTVLHGLRRAEWLLANDPEWSRRYALAVAELNSAETDRAGAP